MDSSQRTDEVTCSTNRALIWSGVVCGCAVTLETTGTVGAEIFAFASSACSFGCALAMSGE